MVWHFIVPEPAVGFVERLMSRYLCVCLLVSGCHVLPPPPLLPLHATTAPDERGATTAMVVVGTAGQLLFGGDGWGIALRVERQETTRTALGVELSGGRGDQAYNTDRSLFRHWLVGVRGYGRRSSSSASNAPLAIVYGAGLSLTASGLVTGTLDGGVVASYVNDHAVPVGMVGVALAVPLRRGRPYAAPPFEVSLGPPEPGQERARTEYTTPRTELYLALGLGLVVPVGDTGNQLSIDLSLGRAMRDRSGIGSLSIADAQHVDP